VSSSISIDRFTLFDKGSHAFFAVLGSRGLSYRTTGPRRFLQIENFNAPCVVGFPVDKNNGCPLFSFEPTVKNTGDLLTIIKRVVTFRKAQATANRKAKKLEDEQLRLKYRRKLGTGE